MDPVTTSPPAVPAGPPRRSGLGLFAMVAGVLGVVLCAALIIGVWLGQGWATDRVDELSVTLDGGLERGAGAADAASAQLAQAATDLGSIVVSAQGIASNPATAPDSLVALGAEVTGISDRYQALRIKYSELRESVAGAITTLQQLSRFTPGLSVPEGPVDALATLDQTLVGLDGSVSDLLSLTDASPANTAAAAAIAEQAASLQGGVTAAAGLMSDVSADVDALRADVADTADDLAGYIGLGAAALIVFLVWVLLLNIALILLGRRWRSAGG